MWFQFYRSCRKVLIHAKKGLVYFQFYPSCSRHLSYTKRINSNLLDVVRSTNIYPSFYSQQLSLYKLSELLRSIFSNHTFFWWGYYSFFWFNYVTLLAFIVLLPLLHLSVCQDQASSHHMEKLEQNLQSLWLQFTKQIESQICWRHNWAQQGLMMMIIMLLNCCWAKIRFRIFSWVCNY